jgi:hypothetical protein
VEPLEVGDDEVRSAEGTVLLELDDVQGNVRVDQPELHADGPAVHLTSRSMGSRSGRSMAKEASKSLGPSATVPASSSRLAGRRPETPVPSFP